MKEVGFTGTQRGMTEKQELEVTAQLILLQQDGYGIFHHGDCIGADSQAHDIAKKLGYDIVLHPPDENYKRAFRTKGAVRIEPVRPYLLRNRDIVASSTFLIAAPKTELEELRSGTWTTVRYARKAGIFVKVVLP